MPEQMRMSRLWERFFRILRYGQMYRRLYEEQDDNDDA